MSFVGVLLPVPGSGVLPASPFLFDCGDVALAAGLVSFGGSMVWVGITENDFDRTGFLTCWDEVMIE